MTSQKAWIGGQLGTTETHSSFQQLRRPQGPSWGPSLLPCLVPASALPWDLQGLGAAARLRFSHLFQREG